MIPSKTDIFLKSLKSLALMEFLPTDKFADLVKSTLGIKQECKEGCDQKEFEIVEKESMINKLAVLLIIGLIIVVLSALVLILRFCVKACPKINRCYQAIKQSLFYGTLIRYILLGTLKMQITFCAALAIKGRMIPETVEQPMPDSKTIITAAIIMGVLSLAPFIFALVLCRNRDQLNHTEVKNKIGAMYFALDAKRKYVGTYCVVFLVRRSFFIAVTFLLYDTP
jgi:hypothetical protein